jgi:hypothetical protein
MKIYEKDGRRFVETGEVRCVKAGEVFFWSA